MKKIALIAIVVVMVAVGVFALVSCSDENTLTVATNADFKPFEYMDGKKFVGFDMDLMREIGKRLDKKVKFVNMKFDSIVLGVSSGQYDVGIAGLTINPIRKESVLFSDPYISDAYQVIVVKKENTEFDGLNKEQILEKLQGTKIHVAQGQVGQAFVLGDEGFGYEGIANTKADIHATVALAIEGIRGNEVAFSDNIVADEYCKENLSYKYINVELTKEFYGIATAKSNTELMDKINQALKDIKEDGTYETIAKKYGLA